MNKTAPFSSERRNSTETPWEDRGREREREREGRTDEGGGGSGVGIVPCNKKRQLSTWVEVPVPVWAGPCVLIKAVSSTDLHLATVEWAKIRLNNANKAQPICELNLEPHVWISRMNLRYAWSRQEFGLLWITNSETSSVWSSPLCLHSKERRYGRHQQLKKAEKREN